MMDSISKYSVFYRDLELHWVSGHGYLLKRNNEPI